MLLRLVRPRQALAVRLFSAEATAAAPAPAALAVDAQKPAQKAPAAASAVSSKPVPAGPFQALTNLRNEKKKRHFDQSFELALNLALDPRKQNEQLRVIADLPHGTGKATRVVAFTNDTEQANKALEAGCDIVGGEDLITELARTQQINFDKAVCTQDVVPSLAKVARLLGPRGLMPSKKLGSVVTDLAAAVKRAKAGSLQLRADRQGTVHCGFGKMSMTDEQLMENLKAVILCVENNKPSGVKGKKWVKSAFMTSSMGPSYPLNLIYLDPKNVRFMSKE